MAATGQRRQYDSSNRQAQARANRARILQAATRLFVAQGYAATSVAQIAQEAGVSGPTVFAGFRTKVNLLKEAVDVALTGDDESAPLADRPLHQRVHEAATLDEVRRRLAVAFCEIAVRGGPITLVAYRAADGDPEIARLVASLDEQRLAGVRPIAETIAARLGRTGDETAVAWLCDGLWMMNAPQLLDLVVRRRGWDAGAFRSWIDASLRVLCETVPA